MKKLYAEICKTEAQDDGTLKVWGYASSEAVDSDGETVTAEAMKAALPDYMKFGAVREMHQSIAAGTAIEANVEEDGRTYFGAHVVDPIAVKKVQTGTYKGFSIGGKVTERDTMDKNIIKGLKLVEVSLVDRPANPEAVFTMYKAEGIDDGDDKTTAGGIVIPPLQSSDADASTSKVLVVDDGLAKSMFGVSQLSEILSDIAWLAESAEWESQYEGDNSPLPADLRTWLTMGVDIFRQMAAEETAEMLANLQAMVPQPVVVQVLEQADVTGDLVKAGAKFSADAKDKIGKAHAAIKEASDHLDKLGYKQDDEDDADGKKDDEKKAEVVELMKAANENLAKLAEENATLQKRVKELEDLPAPSKVMLKVVVVGKDDDNATLHKDDDLDQYATPEERAFAQVKKMYTN